MEHQPGDIIHGRYKIISVIGRGAFGETYLAEDTQSPGLVCLLKYLRPQINSPAVLKIAEECFRKEADTMRRLGNYNQQIPQLYDYFEENQKFYLVQEYIEGQNLDEELKTRRLFSETQVIEVLQDILKVLDYIHQHKVIHRDIKPANLIRRKCDNKIFLIDFGAVKEVSTITVNAQGQTISTIAIGTPHFMPPEQLTGKPTYASDIHALGITGFVLLTGRIPQKHPNDEIIWNGVQVNPHLATILDTMMRSDCRERYERAADVLFDLEPLTLVDQTLNQRYKIKSYLGGGGFSYTYLAEDSQRSYQPNCVIKQLKLRVNRPQIWQEAQNRFLTAVTSVEALPYHQQITRFLNHFQNNQEFYLVYEFIEGKVLSNQMTVGNCLSEPEVIALLKDVLEILVFIHQHGVIHGDIKPSNLIQRQQDNKIILIDFAAFKQSVNLEIEQQTIVVKPGGTNGYMPPEQLQNKLKTCSDIYALGMTAIQALTGVSPDQLPTDAHNEVVWNSAQVSRKLARILNKMVRFKSGERYQSAQEVLNDLNDLNDWWWRQFVKLLPILLMLGVVSSIGLIYLLCEKSKRDRADNFYNIGVERTEKGDFKGAITAYDEAIAIDPNFTKALVNKGYAHGKLNDLTEQFSSCKDARKIDPKAYWALLCLGNAEHASTRYEKAITYFDQAISLACDFPNDPSSCADAWNNKGESLLRLQKPDDALKAFEQAIEKTPNYHVAWTNKGYVLLKQSPQKALEAFDKALKIKPDYKPALEGKKTALRRLGN